MFNDSRLLDGEIADYDDEDKARVHAIAHTKLTAQDSVLSQLSDEVSSPTDITMREIAEEDEGRGGGGGGDGVKQSNENGLESDSGVGVDDTELPAVSGNHVEEKTRKAEGSEQETNVDGQKPLSPIEKKLSKQELFKNDQDRPTNLKRNRFTTQRDPFHKDRVPRKSVLKRPNHPSPVIEEFEVTTPSVSPTGDDDFDEEKARQQQMDRKCCVIM